MGSIAASGGYYIAAACDRLCAEPWDADRFHGMIMQLTNVEELMKNQHQRRQRQEQHRRHRLAVLEHRPRAGKFYNRWWITFMVNSFTAVAKGRGMDEARVRGLPTAASTPARAEDLGLVDQFGTLEDAIELAAKRAGIAAEPAVYSPPEQEASWGPNVHGSLRPAAAGLDAVGCAMSGRRHCCGIVKTPGGLAAKKLLRWCEEMT